MQTQFGTAQRWGQRFRSQRQVNVRWILTFVRSENAVNFYTHVHLSNGRLNVFSLWARLFSFSSLFHFVSFIVQHFSFFSLLDVFVLCTTTNLNVSNAMAIFQFVRRLFDYWLHSSREIDSQLVSDSVFSRCHSLFLSFWSPKKKTLVVIQTHQRRNWSIAMRGACSPNIFSFCFISFVRVRFIFQADRITIAYEISNNNFISILIGET